MPIVLAAGPSPRAIFSGPCGPDEADALLAECLVAAGCRLQAARAPGPPSEITGSESPRKRARGKRAGAETAMGGPA